MDRRQAAGFFCIGVALLLFGAWSVQLAREAVPEARTEGPHLLLVLAAEMIAAELLVVAGVGLLYGLGFADRAFLLAMGMLAYSALNHAGAWVEAGAYTEAAAALALGGAGLLLLSLALRQGPARPVAATAATELPVAA